MTPLELDLLMKAFGGNVANPSLAAVQAPTVGSPVAAAPAIGGQQMPQSNPADLLRGIQDIVIAGQQGRDPLGAVARSNSRPSGLTPQSEWDSMFGGAEGRAAREARELNGPAPVASAKVASIGQQIGDPVRAPDTSVSFTPQLTSGENGPFPGVNLMQQTPYGPISKPVPPAGPTTATAQPDQLGQDWMAMLMQMLPNRRTA